MEDDSGGARPDLPDFFRRPLSKVTILLIHSAKSNFLFLLQSYEHLGEKVRVVKDDRFITSYSHGRILRVQ
jgi:hypothetical protein